MTSSVSGRPVIRRAWRRVLSNRSLGLSLLLQSAVFNVIFFLDSFVLGFVSERQLAAVAAASQVAWLYETLITGVAFVSGALVGRSAGAENYGEIRPTLRTAFATTAVVAALVSSAVFIASPLIADVMITDDETADLMATYFRATLVAYAVNAFSMVYETALQALKHQRVVLRAYGIELLVKVVANCVLVFGLGLGVHGVGGALILAKVVRLLLLRQASATLLPPAFSDGESGYGLRTILREAVPIAGSVLLWNVSTLIIASGFGRLPVEQFALYSALNNAMYLLLIPTEAYSRTVSILTTRLIGALSARPRRLLPAALSDAVLAGCAVSAVVAVLGLVYAALIGRVQPVLGAAALSHLDVVVPAFAALVFAKSLTDALTEGLLRPGFKNRFLLWVEVAALPATWWVFHVQAVTLAQGFWYLVWLELFRLLLVGSRQVVWIARTARR